MADTIGNVGPSFVIHLWPVDKKAFSLGRCDNSDMKEVVSHAQSQHCKKQHPFVKMNRPRRKLIMTGLKI